jgi:hypothetical protein
MKQLILILFLFGVSIASGAPDYVTLYIVKVHAIVKPPESVEVQYRSFVNHLGLIESSNQWKVVNSSGCIGKFQFTQATLEMLGYIGITPEKFKVNPSIFPEALQEEALQHLMKYNQHYLDKFVKYIGQVIGGVLITKAGLLGAAHLAGVGGVQKYLTSSANYTDCNGSSVQKYLKEFSGYSV